MLHLLPTTQRNKWGEEDNGEKMEGKGGRNGRRCDARGEGRRKERDRREGWVREEGKER